MAALGVERGVETTLMRIVEASTSTEVAGWLIGQHADLGKGTWSVLSAMPAACIMEGIPVEEERRDVQAMLPGGLSVLGVFLSRDPRRCRVPQGLVAVVPKNNAVWWCVAREGEIVRVEQVFWNETSPDAFRTRHLILRSVFSFPVLDDREHGFKRVRESLRNPRTMCHIPHIGRIVDSRIGDGLGCKDLTNDNDGNNNDNDNDNDNNSNKVVDVRFVIPITRDISQTGENGAPVLHYTPGEFPLPTRSLHVDALCYAPLHMDLAFALRELVEAVCRQLTRLEAATSHDASRSDSSQTPTVLHFPLPAAPHVVSVVFPLRKDEDADKEASRSPLHEEAYLEEERRRLHIRFGLPLDRPLFRTSNAVDVSTWGCSNPQKANVRLRNVHEGLSPSGVVGGQQTICFGTFDYYHYMQDNVNDDGWGCAYRSLQTILSWFVHQHYTSLPVPSHEEIQRMLVELGDKAPRFVGSRQWIGAIELSLILDHRLGITSRILNVTSGAELATKGRELAQHFATQGTPVMIGGGVLAYTLLGVDFNDTTGDIRFLILDPHYKGPEDLRVVQRKGWCGWKTSDLFRIDAFYNLLLPQRPVVL